MYFTYALFTDILFISKKTLQFFLKTPNSASGHKMCDKTMCNTWSCVFHFVTFRIIMEIWDFCLEISLKNHGNFSRLVCGNPVIPQCSTQNRNVYISVLNGALWDLEQVHFGFVKLIYWRSNNAYI